jgi:hypothetical protein
LRRSDMWFSFNDLVIRGLDPRIHLALENDGLPGQARQ